MEASAAKAPRVARGVLEGSVTVLAAWVVLRRAPTVAWAVAWMELCRAPTVAGAAEWVVLRRGPRVAGAAALMHSPRQKHKNAPLACPIRRC